MEANRHRNIQSGAAYTSLFSPPNHTDSVISPNATIPNTVELIKKTVQGKKGQTAKIAPTLIGRNLKDTCRNIWDFVYNHIQYKRDEAGKEQIRSPRRSWADRHSGVDCDCYTVFISSILSNLNIPHVLRVTKYKADWQHIYVIVPKDGDTNKNYPYGGNYYTIDCVTDQFDFEVKFSDKLDYPMKLYALDGLDDLGRKRDLSKDKAGEWQPKHRKTIFGKALQKIGRGVAKVGLAPIRASFLLAFKINFKKVGSKLRWAYTTPEDAQAKGKISPQQHEQIRMQLLKIQDRFAKAGGNAANLKNAILRGKGNKDGKVGLSGLQGYYDLDFAALPDAEWQENTTHLGELGIAPAVLLPAVAAIIESVLKALQNVPTGEDSDDSEAIEGLGSVQTKIQKAQRVIAKIEAIKASRALTTKEIKALTNAKAHLAALQTKVANAQAKKDAKTAKKEAKITAKAAKKTAKATKKTARKQKVNLSKELAKTEAAIKLAEERGDTATLAEQTAKKEQLLASAKAQGIDLTKLVSNAAIILRKVAQVIRNPTGSNMPTTTQTTPSFPINEGDYGNQSKSSQQSSNSPSGDYSGETTPPVTTVFPVDESGKITDDNSLLPTTGEDRSKLNTTLIVGGAVGLGLLAWAISSKPQPQNSRGLRGASYKKKRRSKGINGFEAVPLS